MTETEHIYYSVNQVAKILQVDRETILRWLKQGKLLGRKFGGVWRIPKESLNIK